MDGAMTPRPATAIARAAGADPAGAGGARRRRRTRAAAVAAAAVLSACGSAARARSAGRPVDLTVHTADGRALRTVALRGRPVVLHLFSVGALPAMLDVDALNDAHDRGLATVIGVALGADATDVTVAAWAGESGAHYPVALGGQDVLAGRSDLGPVTVVPTTVILDAVGRIAYRIDRPLRRGELAQRLATLARR